MPAETARAFRHCDEDGSTVVAGIDGSRAPVLRMPKLVEVHEQPLGRGLKTLRGRRTECETLDHLLESVRAGQSGALVVRGKPGIGKTALLEYAIDSASDLSVVRAAAVEPEIELPFAGLHQLCVPLLDRLAWSTMRSGWIGSRRRRWHSWRAGCWLSPSPSSLPATSRKMTSAGCRNWWFRVCRMVTHVIS